jgi:hypothetical protein
MTWLIESGAQKWWDGRQAGSKAYFTADPNEALRFARFEDAECARCWLLEPIQHLLRSTEHVWAGDHSLTAREAALTRAVDLIDAMMTNDPNEPVSDAGHTVLELWKIEAEKLRALAASPSSNTGEPK